jgi:LysM repeat protein
MNLRIASCTLAVFSALGSVSIAAAAATTIEAESMTLSSYKVENGNRIMLTSGTTSGTASKSFSGSSGTYDIQVYVVGETDGRSALAVYKGTTQLYRYTYPLSNTATSFTIPGVALSSGQTIKLVGTPNAGARARVDKIVLTQKTTSTTSTTSTSGAPSVSIKAPASGATLSGTVWASGCEALASDSNGIKQVRFYLDGTALNTEYSAPYNCSFDTRKFADGAHALKAVATDALGVSTTAQIGVSIRNSTTTQQTTSTTSTSGAPTVSIKAPASGATISGTISARACEALASDSNGIKQVRFYLDGTALNTEYSAPYNCTLDTRRFADGAHTLKAVATDALGVSTAAQIGVTVKNGTTTSSGSTSTAACANPSGGYQGFGRYTTGGAGKPVYRVTNRNNSGAGSLRDALSQGNRCVVFDVGGTITLSSNLLVRGANVTIDGLTAPSPGITLKGGTLVMQGSSGASNVVLRGIRHRSAPAGADGIRVYNASNIVIDRVSVSGYGDGGIDVTERARNVTIQWSILGKGNSSSHNFANLIAYSATRITSHHNLYINGDDRHPYCGVSDSATSSPSEVVCDVRNNVVWNYLVGTTLQDFGNANVVNNYYYSTRARSASHTIWNDGTAKSYVSGNVSKNGYHINGTTRSTPFSCDPVSTTDALSAAKEVKAKAGARGPKFGLDSIDQGYLTQVSL